MFNLHTVTFYKEYVRIIKFIDYNWLALQREDDSIDIRSTLDLSLKANFKFWLGWVSSFAKVGDTYIFGCEKGLAKTDTEFSLKGNFKTKKEVQDIIVID